MLSIFAGVGRDYEVEIPKKEEKKNKMEENNNNKNMEVEKNQTHNYFEKSESSVEISKPSEGKKFFFCL